jgi:hypothetical protein
LSCEFFPTSMSQTTSSFHHFKALWASFQAQQHHSITIFSFSSKTSKPSTFSFHQNMPCIL